MTKVDIFSGFLGAGKTTLIKKLIAEAYKGQKLVLIENEFGDIGIDGGFMQEAGIQVNEMNSGCICCSLVGDFSEALQKVAREYAPDRILIEPSGVGKLSEIIIAVQGVPGMEVNSATTVCDAKKCRMYAKNFGEFYDDQVEHAGAIVLSRTQDMDEAKLSEVTGLLRERNPEAVIITTPWNELPGEKIVAAIERTDTLEKTLAELKEEAHEHHHEHEHEEHEHEEHEHEHEEHEHHHEHEHEEHEHHHDDEPKSPHMAKHDHEHHHHHHDHDHDADEIFEAWGLETAKKFSEEDIEKALSALDSGEYGQVLRAKGIVETAEGKWIHFDHVPGEKEIRYGTAEITGRLCVIGSELNGFAIDELFGV